MNKIKKYFTFFILFFPFFPVFVFANAQPENFAGLIGVFVDLLNLLVPLLISLAVLAFLTGVAIFIWRSDNETERSKGKQFMFWGIIGLFVMTSLWGLVNVLENTFFGSGSGSGLNLDRADWETWFPSDSSDWESSNTSDWSE